MPEAQKQRRWSIEGPDIAKKQDLLGDPLLSEIHHRPILGDTDRERYKDRWRLVGQVL